jgi:hypothetical protein
VRLQLQIQDKASGWKLEHTQVTCHVGVTSSSSCGQRHRNTFSSYLLICTITNIIHESKLFSRLVSMRLVSGLGLFNFPPTHSYITMALHHLPILKPNPVEEDRWKGVHPPSPLTFAPWSSRRHVVCFHAPPRLPGSVTYPLLLVRARKSARWFPPPAISWSQPYLVAQNNILAVANECPHYQGTMLSNLYPTQSSIPSHNVYFESLQAFMYNSSCGWGIHYQRSKYCRFCYQSED